MIPGPWSAIILSMAAYRLVRFLGWDDWPPIYKARAWLIGERWVADSAQPRISDQPGPYESEDLSLPGKQPPSEALGVRPAYDRPLLAHFMHCPFCLSWWVCLTGWICWLIWPHAVTWIAVPWAASGTVGLVAKNLDA